MRWFGHVLAISIVTMLMVGFFPTLFGNHPAPNFILAGAMSLALVGRFREAWLWGVLGGFLLDTTLVGRGFYSVTFICLLALLQLLFERVLSRSFTPFSPIVIGLVVMLLPTVELFVSHNRWSFVWVEAALANLVAFLLIYPFLANGPRKSMVR